jgi:two-component SAPR family response regulator
MSNYKILLIDDDRIFNFLHSKIIERINTNHDIIAYESPFEALQYLLNLSESDLPDIIFLDINMPELNGFEFIDKIKEQASDLLKHLNIVIITSSLSPNDYEVYKQYNVLKAFYNKPLDLEKLESILNNILPKN